MIARPTRKAPPFSQLDLWDGNIEILYATDREPAAGLEKEKYYGNARGYVLRLGRGEVTLGKGANPHSRWSGLAIPP